MIGTYAQVIALISYGNEYLQTGTIPDDFFPGNSSFYYTRSVQFARIRRCNIPFYAMHRHRSGFADNPLRWFYQLRQRGCRAIRLAVIAGGQDQVSRQAINLSPVAGTWLIETIEKGGVSSYWTSEWELVKKGSARRWNVRYTCVDDRFPLEQPALSVAELKHQLQHTLRALLTFTRERNLTYWTATFGHALAAFDESDPCADYFHKDVLVARRYTLPVRQLLFAAAKSWVFEGVGSWSDLSFKDARDGAEHKSLTKELYHLTSMALLVCVNTFQPQPGYEEL